MLYEIGKYYNNKGVYAGCIRDDDAWEHVFVGCGYQDSVAFEDLKKQEYSQGVKIPNLREAMLIFIHKNIINKKMAGKDFDTLNHGMWTSSSYQHLSFVLDLNTGNAYQEFEGVKIGARLIYVERKKEA